MKNFTLKLASLAMGMFAICTTAMAQETGIATASFVNGGGYYDDSFGQMGIAYEKTDEAIVLKNFVNGQDLKINIGEYDGSGSPLQIEDCAGVGSNADYADEWGLEYAIYKFEQNIVFEADEVEFIYMDMYGVALSYFQNNKNELVLNYQSAITEHDANIKIDFNTPWEGDMPVGVSQLTVQSANHAFDLMGRKLQQPAKGLNVINGRKVLNF